MRPSTTSSSPTAGRGRRQGPKWRDRAERRRPRERVVEDNVVAPHGRVVVAESGWLQGDVVSRHRPVVESGGRFDGEWERWNPRAWSRGEAIFARIAIWIAFTVSTVVLGLILGLLAPRASGAVHEAARERIGPVIGWGVPLTMGLPVVALLVMATIVGLPLGLATLLALGLVYGSAGAWVLGRTMTPRARPILSFLAGEASCGLSLSSPCSAA